MVRYYYEQRKFRGPVIKLGNSSDEDYVIGIATFIQNPFHKEALQSYENAKNSGWDIRSGNFSQTDANKLSAKSSLYSSYGISGCVDIDHFLGFTRKYFQK